jgi:pyruvate oxidase
MPARSRLSCAPGSCARSAPNNARRAAARAACLTIAGPGATNLLTGLWDAKVDRSPVPALTGQVATHVLGPGDFQEVDLSAAFAPVAGFSQTVLESSRHAELMSLACKHAILRRDLAHLTARRSWRSSATLTSSDRPPRLLPPA